MIRNSTGLLNAKQNIGQARALTGGVIELRTGSQPDTGDAASAGTVLGIITKSGGTHTCEVQAVHLFDLTGMTTAETITSITVSGIEILGATITYSSTLAATTALVAAQINRYCKTLKMLATATSTGVTVTAPVGVGADLNNATIIAQGTAVWNGAASHFQSGGVAATVTPNTWSSGNGRFAVVAGGGTAGVASANGLSFEAPSAGLIVQNPLETWTLTWLAAGVLGHFRMKGPIADSDALSTTLIRKDGSIGVAGTDCIVSSTSITAAMVGTTATVSSFACQEA